MGIESVQVNDEPGHCAEFQAFIQTVEAGVPISPDATSEERAAMELANIRVRELLAVAIANLSCG